MAVANRYQCEKLVLNAATDVLIPQVSAFALNPGIEKLVAERSGNVDPVYIALTHGSGPALTGSTQAIAIFWGQCGISGVALSGTNTLEAYLRQMAFAGTRSAGSTCQKLAIASGLLIPTSLSAGHQSPASISFAAYAVSSDGVAEPITYTESTALAAATATEQLFFAGVCKYNSTTVKSDSIEMDFGIDVEASGDSGLLFNDFVGIRSRGITIRQTTRDLDALYDLFSDSGDLRPGVTTSTNTVVYLRKDAAGAGRTAAATGAHISLTPTEGVLTLDGIDMAGVATLSFQPTDDGTNPVIAYSAAAAIA